MRFLIVSDTHGDANNLKAVLTLLGRVVDGIIHCGDGASDLAAAMHHGAPMPPDYPVRGNTDSNFSIPPSRIIIAGDRRLLVAHGHQYLHSSSITPLLDEARRNKACACFFGHTHIPYCKTSSRVLLVNPGSLSRPRCSWGPSFAVVEIPLGDSGTPQNRGGIDVKFYELKGTCANPRLHSFRP
jgi:putative phosphoesterase